MKYYNDIDGLRAIAVLSVIFYHLGFSFFSGGFAGVDVFFVISGFLITKHILMGIEAGEFTLKGFYTKRIRRIVPALFFVVSITIVFSIFILPIDSLVEFSYSIFSVSTFTSNIFFWTNLDYFSVAAEMKPLLHTWSLSVEEQFYIIFPLLMLLIKKIRKVVFFYCLIFILLFSFGISASSFGADRPVANFYFPITRFWEFLAGALLVFIPIKPKNNALYNSLISIFGFVLIFFSIVYLNKDDNFPGINALPVVLGTALIIFSSKEGTSFLSPLLSNKYLVYLGLISYSLYLWHWPIIVLSKHIIFGELKIEHTLIILIITFILSMFTYKYIEQPFRRNEKIKKFVTIKTGLSSLVILSIFACLILIYVSDDVEKNKEFNSCFKQPETMESLKKCSFGELDSDKVFFLYGDSHSLAMYPAFEKLALELNWRGVLVAFPGCPSVFDVFRTDGIANAKNCTGEYSRYVEQFLFENNEKIDVIFLVSRWRLYEKGWIKNGRIQSATHYLSNKNQRSETANESSLVLQEALKNTIYTISQKLDIETKILISVPTLPLDISKLGQKRVSKEEYLQQRNFIDPLFYELGKVSNLTVIDPISVYCGPNICYTNIRNKQLYSDDNHVSTNGALLLYPLLKDSLKDEFNVAIP